MKEIRSCKRCVMDEKGDSFFSVDKEGFCSYCKNAINIMKKEYHPGDDVGNALLKEMIERIQSKASSRKYDCIMGLSGGLDSSYLLYKFAKNKELRILVVHIDDDFDTPISKSNIEKLIKKTECDFVTVTPDKKQYIELTKAYMRAGVPNLCVPQDNILFAELHKHMRENKIPFFLSGSNYALESILQEGNTHNAYDVVQIKDIYNKFGHGGTLDKLTFITSAEMALDQRLLHYETLCPLNLMDYRRDKAFKELNEYCGFQYYGSKHLENYFTAFMQLYWLPKKFNVDKRKSHLSSMIISGQMTRDEAIVELERPLYSEEIMTECISVVKDKLEMTDSEFREIMNAPARSHDEFETERDTFSYKIKRIIGNTLKRVGNSSKTVNYICDGKYSEFI